MGKFKDFSGTGIKRYCGNLFGYLNTLLDKYLADNHIKFENEAAERPQYIKDHLAEIEQYFLNEPLEIDFKYAQGDMDEYGKKTDPDYQPLTSDEQAEREAFSKTVREKIYKKYLEKWFSSEISGKSLTRSNQALLYPIDDNDAVDKNNEFAGAMKGSDPVKKQEFLLKRLDEISKINVDDIDFLSDKSIAENVDRVVDVMLVAGELQSFYSEASEIGLDLREEKYQPMIARLSALNDLVVYSQLKLDLMVHPLYSQLRVENMGPYFAQAETSRTDFEDFVKEKGLEENKSYADAMNQLKFLEMNKLGAGPLFDAQKTTSERFAEYRKQHAKINAATQPKVPKNVIEDGKLVPAYIENGKVVGEREHYRTLFKQNLDKLKQIRPGFTMSDEEIDKYITPERIALHKQARRINEDYAVVIQKIKNVSTPTMFSRINAMIRPRGSEDSNRAAQEMDENMSSHTKEGDMFRRHLVVDWSNKLVDLDPSKLNFKGDFNEEAQFALENMDALKFGWDYQKMREDMPFSGGFSVTEEQKANHTKVEAKGQVMGKVAGAYLDLMNTELFLTLPFDKLTEEDLGALTGLIKDSKVRNEIAKLFQYIGRDQIDTKVDNDIKKVSIDDFVDTKPSAAEIITKLNEYKAFLDEEIPKKPNSTEAPNLVKAIDEAIQAVSKGDAFTPQNADDLYKVLATANAELMKSQDFVYNGNDFLRYCASNRYLFDSCLDSWEDEFAKDYYNELNQQPVNEDIEREEALYNKGVELTNTYYKDVENLKALQEQAQKEHGEFTPQQELELHIKESIAEARSELLNYVGKDIEGKNKELDTEKLKEPIAHVIYGLEYLRKNNDGRIKAENYDAFIRKKTGTVEYENAIRVFHYSGLSEFLAGVNENVNKYVRDTEATKDQLAELRENTLNLIAEKLVRAKLEAVANGKNPAAKAKAEYILGNEGSLNIAIKDTRADKFFRKAIDQPGASLEDLQHVLASKPATLLKAVQNVFDKSLKNPMSVEFVSDYFNTHHNNAKLIKDAFYEDWLAEGNLFGTLGNNPNGIRTDRSGLVSLVASRMLQQGYSYENIMDPDVLKEERASAFRETVSLVLDPSENARRQLGELYAYGAQTSQKLLGEIFDKADLNDPTCLMKNNTYLANSLSQFCLDCVQELEHNNEIKPFGVNKISETQRYSDFVMQEIKMVDITKAIFNGCVVANTLIKGDNNVKPQDFEKSMLIAKMEREAILSAKKANPKQSFLEILDKIPATAPSGIVSSFALMQGAEEKLQDCLKDPASAKEFGKRYLSGKLDKSYKINMTVNKETQQITFDISNFGKAIDSLPKSPKKSNELVH